MKSIILVAFLGFFFFSSAQDSTGSLVPVTITASLKPLPQVQTGRNIISIPGSYFDRLPVHSIDELLRYIPGIEVQQRGPAGSQSDILLRGGTFQQVLIILDGIRLNDPNTGHFNGYIPIAPAEISRIEVLKGASSAIYGSEAVGGVIHIITKTFSAKKGRNHKNLGVSATKGEYELLHLAAGGIWQQNNTAVSGGVLSNYSKGQQQRGTRGFYRNQTASVSLNHFLSEHLSFSWRTSIDQRNFSAQNFYTSFISDTANEKLYSFLNHGRINYQKNKHSFSLAVGYKTIKDQFQFNQRSTANDNRSGLLQLSLSDHIQLSERSVFSSGVQYLKRKIRSNDRGNHNADQAAAFFIWHQKINHFSISPSLRLDHQNIRGLEWIPQLNFSYNKGNMQFRASAGKTIRDADFTEQFNNYNKPLVTGGSIGNPNLHAEQSWSYEAGADYFAFKQLRISVTAFQRRHWDLIDWVPTPYIEMPRKDNLIPTGQYALAKNISTVVTSGVETDLQYNHSFNSNSHLLTTVGLLLMRSRSSDSIPSFYISSHAKFLGNLNIEFRKGRFAINATALYKSREHQKTTATGLSFEKNYFVLHSRMRFDILEQKLNIFAEADNITDTRASDLLGTQIPGRWLMGGVQLSL